MASKRNGTLYVGVTNDLHRRITKHKNGTVDGFAKKYRINLLVYAALFEEIYDALCYEKRLKRFYRHQKIKLIEEQNPQWCDLSLHGF